MSEDKMSEDKMPGNLALNLALILAHTLTGHCPFQFLSTHSLSITPYMPHKHCLFMHSLSISLSIHTHTHTHMGSKVPASTRRSLGNRAVYYIRQSWLMGPTLRQRPEAGRDPTGSINTGLGPSCFYFPYISILIILIFYGIYFYFIYLK